jgi:hypothetical protein
MTIMITCWYCHGIMITSSTFCPENFIHCISTGNLISPFNLKRRKMLKLKFRTGLSILFFVSRSMHSPPALHVGIMPNFLAYIDPHKPRQLVQHLNTKLGFRFIPYDSAIHLTYKYSSARKSSYSWFVFCSCVLLSHALAITQIATKFLPLIQFKFPARRLKDRLRCKQCCGSELIFFGLGSTNLFVGFGFRFGFGFGYSY